MLQYKNAKKNFDAKTSVFRKWGRSSGYSHLVTLKNSPLIDLLTLTQMFQVKAYSAFLKGIFPCAARFLFFFQICFFFCNNLIYYHWGFELCRFFINKSDNRGYLFLVVTVSSSKTNSTNLEPKISTFFRCTYLYCLNDDYSYTYFQ